MAGFIGPFGYLQYQQGLNVPHVQKIVDSYIKDKALLTYFHISPNEGTLLKVGKRIDRGFPNVTHMPIGQNPTIPFVVDNSPYQEGCDNVRDIFTVDKSLKTDKNYVPGWMEKQADLYLQSRVISENNYFINNAEIYGIPGDPQGFIGLKPRLANPSLAYGTNPACSLKARANLSFGGISAASNIALQNDFQRILDHMGLPEGEDSGSSVTAIVNPQVMRMIDSNVQTGGQSGGFTTSKDAFGRHITMFRGMKIVSCGYQVPDANGIQITPIIDSNQDANGWSVGDPNYVAPDPVNGPWYTTAYFVRSGEDYFSSWQPGDPYMEKGVISGTFTSYILFEKQTGIWIPNTRSIARLYGIACNGPAGD